MFKNLKAEMARRDLTQRDLGALLGWSATKTSRKLSGAGHLSLAEASAIRKAIGTDIPLEVLFETTEG